MKPTLVIDLTQPELTLWRNIQRKRRGDITRAKRRGVHVHVQDHREPFITLLIQTRHALDIQPFRPALLDREGVLFTATHDDQLLAGEFFQSVNNRLRTRVAASDRFNGDTKTLAGLAHAYLIWESIRWAKANGFTEYDFGGYNMTKHPNVSRWKASFGGTVTERPYS